MKGKTLAQLYADLGVTKTHSRPHTSNDNPFSEAHFKTLKYRPEFPKRFGGHEHARSCSSDLINWYNHEHHHSALNLLTPHDVHYGLGEERLASRAAVMGAAYQKHPQRFVHGPPRRQQLTRAVWINPPTDHAEKNEAGPEGPAPSVLLPTRRSGCSSAEPYPPNRLSHITPNIERGNFVATTCHPRLDHPHPDAPKAENLGGLGAEPPAYSPTTSHLH